MAVALLAASQMNHADAAGFSPTDGRPFSVASPFNVPIGASPGLDVNNAALSTVLKAGDHGAAIYQYGVPVYNADATTPTKVVPCTENWGVCPTASPVPILANAKGSAGTDGALVVIDWTKHLEYDYWQYNGSTTSWSTVQSIDGVGNQGGAVGAGVSRLAGVVRGYEISNGEIDHALVFSSDVSCPTTFRYPATKTDGWNNAGVSPCLEEGARIQLDPSIDLDAMAGLSTTDRIIGKALQKYGAYNIDNGGSRMAIVMESSQTGTNPYAAMGLTDYQNFNLPWDHLRVLKSWNAGTTVSSTSVKPTTTTVPKTTTSMLLTATTLRPTTTLPSTTTTMVPRATTSVPRTTVTTLRTTTTTQRTTTTNPRPATTTTSVLPRPVIGEPAAPVQVAVAGKTSSSVTLTWRVGTGGPAVAKYNVWRGDSNYGNWMLVGSVNGATVTFTDNSVSAHTTYVYGIRAIDATGGVSNSSLVVKATTSGRSGWYHFW